MNRCFIFVVYCHENQNFLYNHFIHCFVLMLSFGKLDYKKYIIKKASSNSSQRFSRIVFFILFRAIHSSEFHWVLKYLRIIFNGLLPCILCYFSYLLDVKLKTFATHFSAAAKQLFRNVNVLLSGKIKLVVATTATATYTPSINKKYERTFTIS